MRGVRFVKSADLSETHTLDFIHRGRFAHGRAALHRFANYSQTSLVIVHIRLTDLGGGNFTHAGYWPTNVNRNKAFTTEIITIRGSSVRIYVMEKLVVFLKIVRASAYFDSNRRLSDTRYIIFSQLDRFKSTLRIKIIAKMQTFRL